jgi:hypothetical protein
MRFKFTPQSQHLHVDASIEDVFVHTGGLEELLAGEWPRVIIDNEYVVSSTAVVGLQSAIHQ